MRIVSDFFLLLDKKDIPKVYFIIFLILLLTLFELLGIASVLPLITLILSPEKFQFYTANFNFLDNLQNLETKLLLAYFCIFFFFVFLIKNIFIVLSNNFIHKFVYNFRTKTYIKLLNLYLHQKYIFFSNRSFVITSNTLNVEVNNLAHNFVRPCLYMFAEIMILLSIIIFAFFLGYFKVIFIGLLFLLLTSIFLKNFNKKIKELSENRIEKNENIVKSTQQIILGIKEILLSGNVKKIIQNFFVSQSNLEKIDASVSVRRLLPRGVLEVLVITLLLISILYYSRLNQTPEEFFIILSFYLAAAYRVLPSLNTIFVSYQQIKFGIPSLNKVLEDLKLKEDLIYSNDKEKIYFKENIKLKNINFGFSKRDTLFKKINFEINKNEIVGIYGESGTGKSTLLNLICKLYDQESGDIIIDNVKVEDKNLSAKYRNLFYYISQDSFLMESTISNNITFESEEKINHEKLQYALNFSQLNKFINSLKDGIETEVSAIQKNISSGQKQRIAMARAIYNAKDILIFDEATNALDLETEQKIISNIFQLKNKHTIILVSHEMRNLEGCDVIYKVKNGKINRY